MVDNIVACFLWETLLAVLLDSVWVNRIVVAYLLTQLKDSCG